MSLDEFGDAHESDGADAIEQIADAGDYNQRRRIKELRDARKEVKDVKTTLVRTLHQPTTELYRDDARPIVCDALTDYIDELAQTLSLRGRKDELLSEEFEIDGADEPVSLDEIRHTRGAIGGRTSNDRQYLTIAESMDVWRRCNAYFAEIAGVSFDSEAPLDPDPV